jgi:hypothetical protein
MWENRQEEEWVKSVKAAIRTFFTNKNYLPDEIRMPPHIYNAIWPKNNAYRATITIDGTDHEIKVYSGIKEKQGQHTIWLGPIKDANHTI